MCLKILQCSFLLSVQLYKCLYVSSNLSLYNQYLEYGGITLKTPLSHRLNCAQKHPSSLTIKHPHRGSGRNRLRGPQSTLQNPNWKHPHPRHGHHRSNSPSTQLSNLNRQFLFKQHHKGMSKSLVARESVLALNPQLKIQAHHLNIK